MNFNSVSQTIKKEFCDLTVIKERGNALEVQTPFSTLNDKLVSVFVTYTNNKIIVTDNGWIHENYYGHLDSEESFAAQNRIEFAFESSYSVKSTIDPNGVKFFYKTCKEISQITSAIFDLGHFCVGVINASLIDFSDDKDTKERERFKSDANDFLKANYSTKVNFRYALDDLKGVKFNAVIIEKNDIFLLSYVTGSSQKLFIDDLRRSIVNFELAQKSKYRDNLKEMLTLINDECQGYKSEGDSQVLKLLSEKTTRPLIPWSNKEKILELV